MPQDEKYQWHPEVRRYRDPSGRFVAESRIKNHVDAAAQAYSKALYDRTLGIVDEFDEESFFIWSTKTRREIELFHTSLAVIALGGKEAAQEFSTQNGRVWEAVGLAIAAQLLFFDRFMLGIVTGTVEINNAMAVRAAMYPLAGFGTFENAVRIREVVAAGFNEEMRELESDNPCPTCIYENSLGWVPIGTLKAIGDSECRSRCRCHFKYRTAPASAV